MLKLSKDFICRKVCGETLVVPVGEKTGDYNGLFTLSESGAFILDELKNGADEKTAAQKLAEEFEIDLGTALQDTREFLDQLMNYGILTEEP